MSWTVMLTSGLDPGHGMDARGSGSVSDSLRSWVFGLSPTLAVGSPIGARVSLGPTTAVIPCCSAIGSLSRAGTSRLLET